MEGVDPSLDDGPQPVDHDLPDAPALAWPPMWAGRRLGPDHNTMFTLPKTSKLVPHKHVEYRATSGGGMLVNMLTGMCFELNRVGAEVWSQLAAGSSVGDTARAVRSKYSVASETVEADVNQLCEEILTAGLVSRQDEGSTPPRDKHVLEPLADGAILLNVDSGVLLRLNLTAAFVWTRFLAGADAAAIVSAFGEAFGVSPTVAAADVGAALAPMPEGEMVPLQAETHYELLGDRYRFSVDGVPVLEVAASGQSLRVLTELAPSELYLHLKALSPKLVALLGNPVLHASAVQDRQGRIMAFLGASGAGKTTTARAFRAAGFSMICEDKLILRREAGKVVAILGGESAIDRWLREVVTRLRAVDDRGWCEVGSLQDVADGATAPLDAIVFVDKGRRHGTTLHFDPVGPAFAASQVFQHAFYGSFTATEWSRYVGVAADIARSSAGYSARVPEGASQLVDAARRYAEKTQS